jgi:hypothetical protein
MKNITLSVDAKDLEALRICAAGRQATANALVRDFLGQLARQRTQAQAAMARQRRLSLTSQAERGPDHKFGRADSHER